jgi:hypothetical protein
VDVTRALSQIAEIHQQIAKAEIYRGYRPVPIAASGLVGLAAALAQPRGLSTDPAAFVRYWTLVAAIAGSVGLVEIAWHYCFRDDAAGRRRTRRVVGQFLPAVIAATVLTVCFLRASAGLVALLPGVWAVCFGVGAFASRPYLPRTSSLVAVYYLAAGAALLWTSDLAAPLSGWQVGVTFCVGQLMAAAVLRREAQPAVDEDWTSEA